MVSRICTILFAMLLAQTGCRSPKTIFRPATPSFPVSSQELVTGQNESISEARSIDDYVQLGLSRNPLVQEAQHKIEAVRHRIPQVQSLPDPMLNTTTYLAPVQTAAGEQAFALGISQKITNAQRRATNASIVAEEVTAAEANLTSVQLEIAEAVRTACFQLLFIRQSLEITNQDKESLERIADVILRQYEVKKSVSQQDVLNVQVEQSTIDNQLTDLRQKEKSYQARLARLLHVDSNSELGILDQLQVEKNSLDIESLIAQATYARPDLKSQLANINRDRKKVYLASLENKPDYTVGLNWIATSNNGISPVANGDDALLLGIGFNLPVYQNRIRAGICEAEANRNASESRLLSLQDKAAEEVFDLVAKLESTSETLALIQEDILPKSQRTLDLSIDKYSTGEISYVQLIANWRQVLRYRVAEANLQSQYGQFLASLSRSVGGLAEASIDEQLPQPEFE